MENPTSKDTEIVISRYNEELQWTANEPFNKYPIIIYNKGGNDNFFKSSNVTDVIDIPNVGRCDHTYLYHIINHYDHLANVTIFLPGSADMDTPIAHKMSKSIALVSAVEQHKDTVFISEKYNDVKKDLYDFHMDEWVASDKRNQSMNSESKL
jgi:hypothetical protein